MLFFDLYEPQITILRTGSDGHQSSWNQTFSVFSHIFWQKFLWISCNLIMWNVLHFGHLTFSKLSVGLWCQNVFSWYLSIYLGVIYMIFTQVAHKWYSYIQTDRQTDRQADRQTDRQTDRNSLLTCVNYTPSPEWASNPPTVIRHIF